MKNVGLPRPSSPHQERITTAVTQLTLLHGFIKVVLCSFTHCILVEKDKVVCYHFCQYNAGCIIVHTKKVKPISVVESSLYGEQAIRWLVMDYE
jgi:hypothetical protein